MTFVRNFLNSTPLSDGLEGGLVLIFVALHLQDLVLFEYDVCELNSIHVVPVDDPISCIAEGVIVNIPYIVAHNIATDIWEYFGFDIAHYSLLNEKFKF